MVAVEELRKAARALVLQIADGDEVPIGALHDFAALTLRCELVQLAQRVQEAPPEFAIRRAMELASLVLTLASKPLVAEAGESADGPRPDCDVVEGKGSTK